MFKKKLPIVVCILILTVIFAYWLLFKSEIYTGEVCLLKITKARHIITGEESTFGSSCLPWFWQEIPTQSIRI